MPKLAELKDALAEYTNNGGGFGRPWDIDTHVDNKKGEYKIRALSEPAEEPGEEEYEDWDYVKIKIINKNKIKVKTSWSEAKTLDVSKTRNRRELYRIIEGVL